MAPRKRVRRRSRNKVGKITGSPADAGSTRVLVRCVITSSGAMPEWSETFGVNLYVSDGGTPRLGKVPSILKLYTQYRVERVGIEALPGQRVAAVVRAGTVNLPKTTEEVLEAADVRFMNTTTTGPQIVWYRPQETPFTAWQEVNTTNVSLQTGLALSATAMGAWRGIRPSDDVTTFWLMVVFDVHLRGLQSQPPVGPATLSAFTEEELEAQLRHLRTGARWSDLPAPRDRSKSRERLARLLEDRR